MIEIIVATFIGAAIGASLGVIAVIYIVNRAVYRV